MSVSGGGAGFGSAGIGGTQWRNNTGYTGFVTSSEGTVSAAGAGAGGTQGVSGGLGSAGGTGGGAVRCGYTNQSGPGTGGLGGACTSGNSFITWLNTGSRLGALN
jgi:hypothetical protein